MNPISMVVLLAALVCNALLAGTFFAFACAIVPGLRRADDRTYVFAVRAVNRAILNGWFLTVFLGAPVFSAVAAWLRPSGTAAGWLVAGAVGAVATFVITAAVNVPLNRRLDAAVVDTDAERAEARRGFERRWNTAHLIRTLTSIGAAGCSMVAIVA